MTVANRIPNASDAAMGITSCACRLVSKRVIGTRPRKVVMEVSKIARKRDFAAFLTAVSRGVPQF